MDRYFFHITDGPTIVDDVGTELPDLNAVRVEALDVSGDLLRGFGNGPAFWSGADWRLDVTDEAGQPVLTLRFSGVQHRQG